MRVGMGGDRGGRPLSIEHDLQVPVILPPDAVEGQRLVLPGIHQEQREAGSGSGNAEAKGVQCTSVILIFN